MKSKILLLWFMLFSLNLAAQNDTLVTKKPVNLWVHTSDGNMVKGKLAGRSGNNLLVNPRATEEQVIKGDDALERIPYHHITTIQTKKQKGLGGMLKGMLIGGAIGFAPVIAGEGGAYVAVLAFPLGLITGAIVGGTSKKNYSINQSYQPYLRFTNKHLP
jgi:hypothetical protein